MLDELRQIAIFAKTIDHGSFRKAANELHLSPSVISHHIAQLEEKLGVTLIYRSTRRLRLTKEGEKLLTSAREMMAAAQRGVSEITESSDDPSGELHIALPSAFSQSKIIDDITAFHLKYPKIRLRVAFSDIKQNQIDAGYDLAIRVTLDRARAANRKSLFPLQRCIVATPAFLAKYPPIAHPDDLEGIDWIELKPSRTLKQILYHENGQDATFQPKGQINVDDIQAVYRFARAGAGLAIIPEFLALEDLESGRMQRVLPEWKPVPVEVYAQWPINATKSGLSKLLIGAFKEL